MSATSLTGSGLLRGKSHVRDRIFKATTLAAGIGLFALLGLLLADLAKGARPVLSVFGLKFFTGTNWNPVPGRESFGALPFIVGTLETSAIAVVLAVPVAVGLALLLNEMPSGWLRNPLTVLVDLLAAIPSIVYGIWGLFVMLPVFNDHVEPFLASTIGKVPVIGALFTGTPSGGNIFAAGVILAVMILPIITAVSREVVAIVPRELREGALALGATRYETIRMAVLPYARSGIVGAIMLGLGRALGETIAVALLVGNGLGLSWSLFRPGYTIPAVIANEFREATNAGLHRSALLALALTLVVIALVLAALSRLLVGRSARLVGKTGEMAPTPIEVAG